MFFYFNVVICLISVFLYVFVYYLIDSFLPFFLCDPFFLPTFIHVPLSWILSFLLPRPCLFLFFFCPSLSLLSLSTLPKFVQRRAQFDSVSLVIQGSMEGELSLMDNLSGSICHYYALPPKPSKHNTDKKVNITWAMTHFLHFIRPDGFIPFRSVRLHKHSCENENYNEVDSAVIFDY